jgi:hypothetical protein
LNEELDFSQENKLNSQPSKEIEFSGFTKQRNSQQEEISQIKDSFKNLEEHLQNFYQERSSANITPVKQQQELDVVPETYPDIDTFEQIEEDRRQSKVNDDEIVDRILQEE